MWGNVGTAGVGLKPLGSPSLFNLQMVGHMVDYSVQDEAGVQDAFWKISGRRDIQFTQIHAITEYRANIHMVSRMQVGHCFLIGDSAHCHSPAGGQGLNTSMQDSFNLGWKLALAHKNMASGTVLANYESERLPVIAEMLNLSTELHGLVFVKSEEDSKTSAIKAMFRPTVLQQIGVNYRHSPIIMDGRTSGTISETDSYHAPEGTLTAGDRAPDAPELTGSTSGTLFGVISATMHTAFVIPDDSGEDTTCSLFTALQPYRDHALCNIVVIISKHGLSMSLSQIGVSGQVTILVDEKGHAFKAYRIADRTPTVILVRPDGVIGAYLHPSVGIKKYFGAIQEL